MKSIKNVKIRSAILGTSSGRFTLGLWLADGCIIHCFGGWQLVYLKGNVLRYNEHLGLIIHKILEIADVDDWRDLPDKAIRIVYDENEIYKIGHITEDKWFEPSIEFEKYNKLLIP